MGGKSQGSSERELLIQRFRSAFAMTSIRPATSSDIDALRSLSEQLGYAVPAAAFSERLNAVLAHRDHALLVAEEGGYAIGWVHGMLRPLLVEGPQIFIGGLVVEESFRGQRIGEQLMVSVEAWGRSQGAHEVYVYSNVMREHAHRFYERIGYQRHKTPGVFKKSL